VHFDTSISHWLGNPLLSAAPGTKVDVEISLTVHASDWDVDAFVIGHAPQVSSTGQQATAPPALHPAAAAGSSQQQHDANSGLQQPLPGAADDNSSGGPRVDSGSVQGSSSSAATYGPFHVKASLNRGLFRLSALPAADIMADYARGAHTYDVVLQQQVSL
jgi:hypothetical protein